MAKVGVFINPEPQTPVSTILGQARAADRQGFESIWLGDHLIDYRDRVAPEGPPDSFTLMTAIGAQTSRIRLAWGMLNPSFRNPALLAKMLATLDQITGGRVICSLGAGWLMMVAGLQKSALERRRRRRVCPSCGREIHARVCSKSPGIAFQQPMQDRGMRGIETASSPCSQLHSE